MYIKADQHSVVTVERVVGFVQENSALVKRAELSDLVGHFEFCA